MSHYNGVFVRELDLCSRAPIERARDHDCNKQSGGRVPFPLPCSLKSWFRRSKFLQGGVHVHGGLIAVFTVLLQCLVDRRDESWRQCRIQFARRQRWLFEDSVFHHGCCFAAECSLSGGHLLQDKAEGEDVSAGVQRVTAHLLGRHVAGGAQGDAKPGKGCVRRAAG